MRMHRSRVRLQLRVSRESRWSRIGFLLLLRSRKEYRAGWAIASSRVRVVALRLSVPRALTRRSGTSVDLSRWEVPLARGEFRRIACRAGAHLTSRCVGGGRGFGLTRVFESIAFSRDALSAEVSSMINPYIEAHEIREMVL